VTLGDVFDEPHQGILAVRQKRLLGADVVNFELEKIGERLRRRRRLRRSQSTKTIRCPRQDSANPQFSRLLKYRFRQPPVKNCSASSLSIAPAQAPQSGRLHLRPMPSILISGEIRLRCG
jgi:hypothetical protein